jgi:hypothetical protein
MVNEQVAHILPEWALRILTFLSHTVRNLISYVTLRLICVWIFQ